MPVEEVDDRHGGHHLGEAGDLSDFMDSFAVVMDESIIFAWS